MCYKNISINSPINFLNAINTKINVNRKRINFYRKIKIYKKIIQNVEGIKSIFSRKISREKLIDYEKRCPKKTLYRMVKNRISSIKD